MFRVLAFTVKPRESPDTRYRVLQYHAAAEKSGIHIDHRSLMGPKYFQWQIRNEQSLLRLVLYPVLLLVRLWEVLVVAPKYDAVWISREMAPLGPAVFEKLLISRCRRVIMDVDDALHISDKESSRLIPRLLRDRGKFSRMASAYTTVVCGNEYLAEFYRAHGAKVEIVPTVVDADRYAGTKHLDSTVTRIGWIGTPLNRHHVEFLYPALSALALERRFELVLVGLNEPLNWDNVNVRYMKWTLAGELDFFANFDIGIMPLKDSPFARGKCAFKLVQYMAAGLPVVASPVGANCEVVRHGENGYLAGTQEDWQAALRTLIDDPALGGQMGARGQELVQRSYSVKGVWPRYAAILTGTGSTTVMVQEEKECAAL